MRLPGRRLLLFSFLLTLPLVTPRLRGADEIEYFAYLRSFVFDGDLEFGNEYQHFYERDPQGLQGFKQTFLDLREPRTGAHINFAPAGTAILWAPAYLAAHLGVLAARALGAQVLADGYSLPYVAAACYASAGYAFLGLLLIHDGLTRHAGVADLPATLAVLAAYIATPLLYYTTLAPGFSHAASVFAVALVVWLSLRLRARADSRLRDWALCGAAVGVAGLVREQDALFGIVPLGVLLAETWRTRDVAGGVAKGAALGLAAFLVFSLQLLAYRAINGSFAPSRLVARKMSYGSPHLLEVLFDPGHGLFAWTPLLLVAVVGLLLATVRKRDLVCLLLAASFLLQAWINGSLESWTQAGAFGSRRFLSATPAFAWGLAFVFAALVPRVGRAGALALLSLCCWWNVSLMIQFGLKLMDRQRLEWPLVARNQVVEVPRRLSRTAWLFFTDRERLVRESR